MYVIPTDSSPNQTFTSTIPINDKNVKLLFFIRYNTEQNVWIMSLKDEENNPIIDSIPLIGGINILEQYSYLNIGSAYIVKLDGNLNRDRPNDTDLGVNFILVWGNN